MCNIYEKKSIVTLLLVKRNDLMAKAVVCVCHVRSTQYFPFLLRVDTTFAHVKRLRLCQVKSRYTGR